MGGKYGHKLKTKTFKNQTYWGIYRPGTDLVNRTKECMKPNKSHCSKMLYILWEYVFLVIIMNVYFIVNETALKSNKKKTQMRTVYVWFFHCLNTEHQPTRDCPQRSRNWHAFLLICSQCTIDKVLLLCRPQFQEVLGALSWECRGVPCAGRNQ